MPDNFQPLQGGGFLLRSSTPESIFIPEEWTEEQKMLAETVRDFCEQEIHSLGNERLADLSADKDMDIILEIFQKAADLGFCGVSIDPDHGGLGLDFVSGIIFGEMLAYGFSFATTIGAQTSIGSLPIVFYGTDEQKNKYLPGIATGEIKACYCLTEPSAGSDANSGKAKAVLNEAGTHYVLNGQKMWITNGGFADLFIVFAKIDDDEDLSAFIIEKSFGGVEIGKEEKKLGIKASSTTQVFFNDCPVPKENLLGERARGFHIALNILNTGRIKLAAGALGGARMGITNSAQYALERKQFGKSISEFGAIQHKLGQMTMLAFATQSALYRTGGYIDEKEKRLIEQGETPKQAQINAVREFAIECALLKVFGSEMADYAVDEALQIFGGMGYSTETGIELGYRDARIMRIYEGTNEINRLLSVAELTKRALKTKELDLKGAGKKLPGYIIRQSLPFHSSDGWAPEIRLIENMKRVFVFIAGTAGRKLGKKMEDEQEIVMNLADILMWVYMAESTMLRVQKLASMKQPVPDALAKLCIYETTRVVKSAGRDAIMSYAEGRERKKLLRYLRILTPRYNVNPKELRRELARLVLDKQAYPW